MTMIVQSSNWIGMVNGSFPIFPCGAEGDIKCIPDDCTSSMNKCMASDTQVRPQNHRANLSQQLVSFVFEPTTFTLHL